MKLEEFERLIHKRLGEHHSYDIDEISLWSSIEGELDEQKKKNRVGLIFRASFTLLLIALGTAFILTTEVNEPKDGSVYLSNSSKNIKSELNTGRFEGFLDSRSDLKSNDTDGKSEIEGINITNKSINGTESTRSGVASSSTQTNVLKETESNGINTNIKGSILKQEKEYANKKGVSFSRSIDYLSLRSYNVSNQINWQALNKQSVDHIPKKRKKRWIMVLEAGLSKANLGINSNDAYALVRKSSENPQLGWQFAWSIYKRNPSGFTLGGGIGFNRSWTRFNYYEESVENIFPGDSVVTIYLDNETMDTVARYYDNPRTTVSIERNIQHHNEFSTISVPVYIGYGMDKGNLGLYILGGLSFDYRIQQKGRLIDESGNVIDFDKDSFYKRTGISLDLKPSLLFAVSSDLYINLSSSLKVGLVDQLNKTVGFKQKEVRYSVMIGVAKEF